VGDGGRLCLKAKDTRQLHQAIRGGQVDPNLRASLDADKMQPFLLIEANSANDPLPALDEAACDVGLTAVAIFVIICFSNGGGGGRPGSGENQAAQPETGTRLEWAGHPRRPYREFPGK
jgi:hypothetical protein